MKAWRKKKLFYFFRLQSCCWGFQSFWSIFHRSNYRCRQSSARKGTGHWWRCGWASCHWSSQKHGRYCKVRLNFQGVGAGSDHKISEPTFITTLEWHLSAQIKCWVELCSNSRFFVAFFFFWSKKKSKITLELEFKSTQHCAWADRCHICLHEEVKFSISRGREGITKVQ